MICLIFLQNPNNIKREKRKREREEDEEEVMGTEVMVIGLWDKSIKGKNRDRRTMEARSETRVGIVSYSCSNPFSYGSKGMNSTIYICICVVKVLSKNR